MMRLKTSLLFLMISALIFASSQTLAAPQGAYPSKLGEWVVRLKPQASMKSDEAFQGVADRLSSLLGLKNAVHYHRFLTSSDFATFKLPANAPRNVVASLKQDAAVAYAEPNYIYHIVGNSNPDPNDAQFSGLWGMKNTGQADAAGQIGNPGSDIHVSPVWSEGVTGNKSVRVAVIDTGVDYNHPDLKANVDAASGFNFVSNTSDALDDHNHGSHCSGTIGGVGNNGVGVVGVNWNVTIIPIKFLDAQGSGSLDGAVQSIQHATKLGVNIMSNSWGGGPFTQSLYDAINDAKKKGILFVAAAGNDANENDAKPSYPASYDLDNIISVAATDNQDKLASFSNYGRKSVHVAAPGVKILSTFKNGAYGVMSGTSMATPHVAGISALLLSANPSLSYAQVKDLLIRSSDKVRALSRKVASGGRVNVYNAIHGIFPVENAPNDSAWKDVSVSIESAHPYENGKTVNYPIKVPGAKFIRVIFDQIDTEAGYDTVEVSQVDGSPVESVSGAKSQYTSDYITGDQGQVSIRADGSVNRWGFKVSKVQAIY